MAPLIGLLLQTLAPVIVSEIQKKIVTEKVGAYAEAKHVPASEYVGPVLKAVAVGTVKSKTGWFSLALVILGFLEANQEFITSIIPPKYLGYAIAGIGAVSWFLRALTTDSLVEKVIPKE